MGTPLVLLPGLDGTGTMFAPFVAELPPWIEPVVLDYPAEPLGYADLARRLATRLPEDRPFFLLGESFGGPLAL
jgi:surfactin synthase thioesterase subunit